MRKGSSGGMLLKKKTAFFVHSRVWALAGIFLTLTLSSVLSSV
jgi:hypothetical protein